MTSTKIVFIIFVAAVAFAATLHHETSPARIQDRMTTTDGRRFCPTYYEWRATQTSGGVPVVDVLCFEVQEETP